MENGKHRQELLSGAAVAFALKVVGLGLIFLFTILITRTLGAEGMGIFSLCLTFLSIFSIFARLGIPTALLRFVSAYSSLGQKDRIRGVYFSALSISLPVGLGFALVFFAGSRFLAENIFHKLYLTKYFQITALGILPMVLMVCHAESLRGLKKIAIYAFLMDVCPYLTAVFMLVSGSLLLPIPLPPIFYYCCGLFVSMTLGILFWFRYSELRKTPSAHTISPKKLLSISLPMMLSALLLQIFGWTNNLMLGYFRNVQELGIYNISNRLAILAGFALMAVNSISAPKFAAAHTRNNYQDLKIIVKQSTKLIFWFSFPIIIISDAE